MVIMSRLGTAVPRRYPLPAGGRRRPAREGGGATTAHDVQETRRRAGLNTDDMAMTVGEASEEGSDGKCDGPGQDRAEERAVA
jgi:hypothetical protein